MLAQLHKWNKKIENNFSNKIKNKERFKQNHRKLMIMKKI